MQLYTSGYLSKFYIDKEFIYEINFILFDLLLLSGFGELEYKSNQLTLRRGLL